MLSRKNNIKTNFIFNLLASVFGIIVPIITTPYISRVIGADGIGVYSYTYSLITMFLLVGSLGISYHAQRIIAIHKDKRLEYSLIFWEILILKFLTTFISFVLFIVFTCFNKNYFLYFIIQTPYFIATVLDISWLYQGLEEFKFIAIRNIIFKLLGVLCVFIFVNDKNDLTTYLILLSLSLLFGNFSLWLSLKKVICKVKFTELNFKKHFKDTMIYFVPTIAYQFYSLIDKVILGIYGNEFETGFYEQSHKIITLAISIVSSYNVVIRSRMSYLFERNDRLGMQSIIDKSIKFILLLSFAITFGIIGISSDLVPWFFGDGYDKVVFLLIVFAPMVAIMSIRTGLGALVFIPFGLQSKSNFAQCLAAALNCILTFILIPFLFSYGAVISSILSEILILVIYIIYVKRYIKIEGIFKLSVKFFVAGVIMLFVIYLIGLNLSGIVSTVIQIIIGTGVYFVVLLLIKEEFVYNYLKKYMIMTKNFLCFNFFRKEK